MSHKKELQQIREMMRRAASTFDSAFQKTGEATVKVLMELLNKEYARNEVLAKQRSDSRHRPDPGGNIPRNHR